MEETLQLYWTGIQIASRMKIYTGKEIAVIASWEIFRFCTSSLFNAQKQHTNTTGSASMCLCTVTKKIFVMLCTQVLYHLKVSYMHTYIPCYNILSQKKVEKILNALDSR